MSRPSGSFEIGNGSLLSIITGLEYMVNIYTHINAEHLTGISGIAETQSTSECFKTNSEMLNSTVVEL